ncbi:PREDICTED: protocadherin alpha-5-like, partial [Corvus brachyrhynchos]|uniref:protocadherin alpha-5-like n=1 Tax=Corvus brachyrhynchos TaxID=85066 RepID=UPI00081635DD
MKNEREKGRGAWQEQAAEETPIAGWRRGRCGGACEAAEQRTVSLQAQERRLGGSAPVLVERPLRVFHVQLEITDINDNAPIFPAARKNLSLSENSPPEFRFPLEGASDADIGANAQLSYTLSPSEHFSLDLQKTEEDGESLFLVLRKSLDRETIPVHRLVLTASDGGRPSLTGTMELVISVLDTNDNAPQFNQSVYKVQLPENAELGTLVIRLNATDLDEGSNSNISYSLQILSPQDGRDVFRIDRKSGEIRLRDDLDFEDVGLYRMQVDAVDKGTPPLSGHCKVLVEVLDVNDNAPEVWDVAVSVPVPEDAGGGRPSLTGTMELLISVLDANDNAPQFNQSVYKVQLPESAEVGTLVTRVNATDWDEGSNSEVTYTVTNFLPSSGRDVISVNPNTGEIHLTAALDFEEVSIFDFRIEARDKGTPPLSGHCKVVLEVLDVNDNAPEVWVTSLSVPVPEDASVGTVVALLSVSDRDSGANGRVRCWVWPASPFGLEATFAGSYSLVLREALDRERVSEYEG